MCLKFNLLLLRKGNFFVVDLVSLEKVYNKAVSGVGRSRSYACHKAEESPGSTETRCWITSSGRDPRESATENIPQK